MRILLIHNEYQQAGGEKTAVAAQVDLLRRRGHEVYLYLRDNQEIEQYGLRQKLEFIANAFDSMETRREIRTIITQFRPHLAHVHNVFPLISPGVYLQLHELQVPIVQTVHNYRFMCANALFYTNENICERCKCGNFLPAVRWRCYRESYALSALYAGAIGLNRQRGAFAVIDRFIALTPFVAQRLVEAGVAPATAITVLGNFLPSPTPLPQEPDLGQPYLVFMGRLSKEKGLPLLLEALNGTGLRAVVLGNGPLAQEAQAYAREHWLAVEFKGYLSGQEKYSILGRALVCVVPSLWYEPFSIAALESAAVGTPVLAANIGGLGSLVVDGEIGWKFTPGDSADLRAKLAACFSQPQLAVELGVHAHEWFRSGYTEDHHYPQLLALYKQTIEQQVAPALVQAGVAPPAGRRIWHWPFAHESDSIRRQRKRGASSS